MNDELTAVAPKFVQLTPVICNRYWNLVDVHADALCVTLCSLLTPF